MTEFWDGIGSSRVGQINVIFTTDAVACSTANTRSCCLLCINYTLHPLPEYTFQFSPPQKMSQPFAVFVQQLNVLADTHISV